MACQPLEQSGVPPPRARADEGLCYA